MNSQSIKAFYSHLTRAPLWQVVVNVKTFDESHTSIIRAFRNDDGLIVVYASHVFGGKERVAMEAGTDLAALVPEAAAAAECDSQAVGQALAAA